MRSSRTLLAIMFSLASGPLPGHATVAEHPCINKTTKMKQWRMTAEIAHETRENVETCMPFESAKE